VRIIRRYVGRQIAFSILLVLSALIMLFSFFDLIYEMRDVGHGEYRLGSALIFVLLSLPGRLYEMFPVAALIGTMFALAQMVLHSEYAVMRTSGVSILAMAGALLQAEKMEHPLSISRFRPVLFCQGCALCIPHAQQQFHLLLAGNGNAQIQAHLFRSEQKVYWVQV